MRKLLASIRAHPWFALGAVLLICAWTLNEALNAAAERRWQEYRIEARKRGARLDFADLLPPPVPDEENFASLPMFKRAFASHGPVPDPFAMPTTRGEMQPSFGNWPAGKPIDWNAWQEYFVDAGFLSERSTNSAASALQALGRYAPYVQEWHDASGRAHSRFPVEWERGWHAKLPHITLIANAWTVFRLRMHAHLALDDSESAYNDFRSGFAVCRALKDEPRFLSGKFRMNHVSSLCASVGEELAIGAWGASQLRRIEDDLGAIRLSREFWSAVAGERPFLNHGYEEFVGANPVARVSRIDAIVRSPFVRRSSNWRDTLKRIAYYVAPKHQLRRTQLRINQFFDALEADIATDSVEVDARLAGPQFLRKTADLGLLFEAYGGNELIEDFRQREALIDQTRVACALERFRLQNGVFPQSLDALVPEFCSQLPTDIASGKPLRYRRVGDSSYRLYSVAANGVDDNGEMNPKAPVGSQLDWAWIYAPPERLGPWPSPSP